VHEVHDVAPWIEAVPALQFEQDVMFKAEYFPAEHGVQAIDPGEVDEEPAAHG
jgi:hypothetical protein